MLTSTANWRVLAVAGVLHGQSITSLEIDVGAERIHGILIASNWDLEDVLAPLPREAGFQPYYFKSNTDLVQRLLDDRIRIEVDGHPIPIRIDSADVEQPNAYEPRTRFSFDSPCDRDVAVVRVICPPLSSHRDAVSWITVRFDGIDAAVECRTRTDPELQVTHPYAKQPDAADPVAPSESPTGQIAVGIAFLVAVLGTAIVAGSRRAIANAILRSHD